MSLFRPQRAQTAAVEQRNAWDNITALMARGGNGTYAGVPVNDETAMRHSAVWGCVDLLSEIVSTMPIVRYRSIGDTSREVPLGWLEDPSGEDTGFEVWARQLMLSLLLRGNAPGFITDLDGTARPSRIEMLHPDRVSFRRDLNFGPGRWYLDGNEIGRYPHGELWHLCGYPIAGTPLGLSPITYAAETVGLGIAARKFGSQWFGDGAHPTSVLTNKDRDVENEDEAKSLKARIKSVLFDNREPLVLGGGWELSPIQIAPEESQFLETIKANSDDIARFFFRRPPGEGGEITYANVEARSIDLLTYSINGWLVRIERALSRLLPRGQYVKFNSGSMLRTDLKTRYEAHTFAIRGGFATPNERRELEDMPPLPGGDELLWPPYSTGDTAEEPTDEGITA